MEGHKSTEKQHAASPLICSTCSKSYKRKKNLDDHVKTVHQGSWHICGICAKNFTREDCLQNHMKCHQNNPSYSCEICNKGFYYQKTFEEHVISHSGNKFKCTQCDAEYTFKSSLKKHLKKCQA